MFDVHIVYSKNNVEYEYVERFWQRWEFIVKKVELLAKLLNYYHTNSRRCFLYRLPLALLTNDWRQGLKMHENNIAFR